MKSYRVLEKITSTKVILNCGKSQGIKLNDEFLIYGLTQPLKDPDSGEDLGEGQIVRGKGMVVHLQDKLCTVESNIYKRSSDKKIIRTVQSANPFTYNILGAVTIPTTTEEVQPGQTYIESFDGLQIGDFAEKIS